MAVWDDLKAGVYVWTNRPTRVTETEQALRNAIRIAHRLTKFWRDLAIAPVTPDSLDATVQTIDLTTACPRLRQVAYVKSGTTDKKYDEITVLDLIDQDGLAKTDIFYGVGTEIKIRSSAPEPSYEIAYYLQPITAPPEAIQDWLLTDYQDLVILLASSIVLGVVGEAEIKKTVDALVVIAAADIVEDQLEVTGR